MSAVNGYCTLADVKARADLTTTDTTRDAFVEQMIEAASRWIDQHTGRHFYALTATRYFTAQDGLALRVSDLASVSTLKTDEDGDRTYETTWAATDYDLLPYNHPPYQWLEVTPNGLNVFPAVRKGVQIAGVWGWPVTVTVAGTTLAEDLDTSEPAVDVVSGTAVVAGQTIRIDSEDMRVESIATNTLTVTRGINGTTAAAHTTGAAISILTPPDAIQEASLLLTARLYKRKDAVFGVAGNIALGQIAMTVPEDRDALALLAPYVRRL